MLNELFDYYRDLPSLNEKGEGSTLYLNDLEES